MKKVTCCFLFVLFFNEGFAQFYKLNELIKVFAIPSSQRKDSLINNSWYIRREVDKEEMIFSSCTKELIGNCEQILIINFIDNSIQLLTRNYEVYRELRKQTKINSLKFKGKSNRGRIYSYEGKNLKMEFSQECIGKGAMFSIKISCL